MNMTTLMITAALIAGTAAKMDDGLNEKLDTAFKTAASSVQRFVGNTAKASGEGFIDGVTNSIVKQVNSLKVGAQASTVPPVVVAGRSERTTQEPLVTGGFRIRLSDNGPGRPMTAAERERSSELYNRYLSPEAQALFAATERAEAEAVATAKAEFMAMNSAL